MVRWGYGGVVVWRCGGMGATRHGDGAAATCSPAKMACPPSGAVLASGREASWHRVASDDSGSARMASLRHVARPDPLASVPGPVFGATSSVSSTPASGEPAPIGSPKGRRPFPPQTGTALAAGTAQQLHLTLRTEIYVVSDSSVCQAAHPERTRPPPSTVSSRTASTDLNPASGRPRWTCPR